MFLFHELSVSVHLTGVLIFLLEITFWYLGMNGIFIKYFSILFPLVVRGNHDSKCYFFIILNFMLIGYMKPFEDHAVLQPEVRLVGIP